MSDTPRTDAASFWVKIPNSTWGEGTSKKVVLAEKMEELERVHANVAAERDEFRRLAGANGVAALEVARESDRMRPVVEAAQKWKVAPKGAPVAAAVNALISAVNEYEKVTQGKHCECQFEIGSDKPLKVCAFHHSQQKDIETLKATVEEQRKILDRIQNAYTLRG